MSHLPQQSLVQSHQAVHLQDQVLLVRYLPQPRPIPALSPHPRTPQERRTSRKRRRRARHGLQALLLDPLLELLSSDSVPSSFGDTRRTRSLPLLLDRLHTLLPRLARLAHLLSIHKTCKVPVRPAWFRTASPSMSRGLHLSSSGIPTLRKLATTQPHPLLQAQHLDTFSPSHTLTTIFKNTPQTTCSSQASYLLTTPT